MSTSTPLILLADDEDDFRGLVALWLESANIDVVQVRDGAEGLAALAEQTFDLLLLDIIMPRLGGFELFAAAQERGLNIPTIFVSTMHDPGTRARAKDLGAADFLSKPVAPLVLIETVRHSLRRQTE